MKEICRKKSILLLRKNPVELFVENPNLKALFFSHDITSVRGVELMPKNVTGVCAEAGRRITALLSRSIVQIY